MPEIIIRYLTIVINHFRARWRITFRVHVIIPSKFRIALVVTLLEMFFFAPVPSSSSLFLSFSFFRFCSKRIACCLRVVGNIRSLKRDMCSKGCGLHFSKGFFYSTTITSEVVSKRSGFSSRFLFYFSIDFFFFLFYWPPCVILGVV